jgi:hypothetical protein
MTKPTESVAQELRDFDLRPREAALAVKIAVSRYC